MFKLSAPYSQPNMTKLFISLSLLICVSSFGQRQLSPQAINELVNKASSFLGFQQNDKVRSAFNKYLTTYNRAGAATAMANLRSDLKGRDDLILIMNRATGSREMLMATLTAMNVNAKLVPEISDYFFPKAVVQKPTSPLSDTVSVPEQPPIKEAVQPFTWEEPSKKFFDGRKNFCDSTGKWYYTVTIIRSDVLLTKYEGQPSKAANQLAPVIKIKAALSGEHIVSSEGYPTNYKYENNMFYEKSENGIRWNRYVECVEK